jgi:hypothetical protein
MDYMHANNMPPVVSPIANNPMPNMPHMMPHVNVFENKNVTENIYLFPYSKPAAPVHHGHYDMTFILVLFILLVIVLRGFHHHHPGKC